MRNFCMGCIVTLLVVSITLNAFLLFCPHYKNSYHDDSTGVLRLDIGPIEQAPLVPVLPRFKEA